MSSGDTKTLEFNQYQKSHKTPSIIYVCFACIIEKIDGCKNTLEDSSTTTVTKHISSGFPMSSLS